MTQSYSIRGQKTRHPGGKPKEQMAPWPKTNAEYRARKRREAALGGKSAPAGTNGRKTQAGAEMDFGDDEGNGG